MGHISHSIDLLQLKYKLWGLSTSPFFFQEEKAAFVIHYGIKRHWTYIIHLWPLHGCPPMNPSGGKAQNISKEPIRNCLIMWWELSVLSHLTRANRNTEQHSREKHFHVHTAAKRMETSRPELKLAYIQSTTEGVIAPINMLKRAIYIQKKPGDSHQIPWSSLYLGAEKVPF